MFTADCVSVIDPRWQKNEASLFQVKSSLTTLKGDGSFQHVEHFIFGLMGVTGWLFPFFRDVFHKGGAIPWLNLTGLQSKVNSKSIRPSLASVERIGLNFPVRIIHGFLQTRSS